MPQGFSFALFGPVSMRDANGVDVLPKSHKAVCMLAYLALQPEGAASRERLCGLLWSERGEKQARDSLRTDLNGLAGPWKHDAGGPLDAGRNNVCLDLTRISVDVRTAEGLIARGEPADLAAAAALWRGELLAGITARDQDFDNWLMIERAHWARAMARAITTGLDHAERRQDDAAIATLAEALLRRDPCHEAAVRGLMELDLRRGEPAAALRRYVAFRDSLARELDMKPSPEVEAVRARARRMAASPHAPTVAPRRVRRWLPRLTVVFRPPVGPPDAAAELGGVLQDELLLGLARARHLAVTTRPFDGSEHEDADYLLFAALTCGDRSGRATFRLVRLPERRLVIGEQVELGENDRQVRLVVEMGRIAFAMEHAIMLESVSEESVEIDAYSLWMAADRMQSGFKQDNLRAAVPLLQRSSEADPLFAKPIAGLASIKLSLPMTGPFDSRDDPVEQGFALARKAVGLDPWDARIRVILAWAYLMKRLPGFALAEFRHALSLGPHDPDVLIACAEGFAYLGETDASLKAGHQAMKIHPNPPDYYFHYLSVAHCVANMDAAALPYSLAVQEPFPQHLAWQTLILSRQGLHAEAKAAADRLTLAMSKNGQDFPDLAAHSTADWLMQTLLVPDPDERVTFIAKLHRYL